MSALVYLGLVAYMISFIGIHVPFLLLIFGGSSGDGLGALIFLAIAAVFLIAAGISWVAGTVMIFLGHLRSPKTKALGNKLLIAGALSVIGSLELIWMGVHRAYTPKVEIGNFTLQFSALIPILGIFAIGLVEVYLGLRARGAQG